MSNITAYELIEAITQRPDFTPEGRERFCQDVLNGETGITCSGDDFKLLAKMVAARTAPIICGHGGSVCSYQCVGKSRGHCKPDDEPRIKIFQERPTKIDNLPDCPEGGKCCACCEHCRAPKE